MVDKTNRTDPSAWLRINRTDRTDTLEILFVC